MPFSKVKPLSTTSSETVRTTSTQQTLPLEGDQQVGDQQEGIEYASGQPSMRKKVISSVFRQQQKIFDDEDELDRPTFIRRNEN